MRRRLLPCEPSSPAARLPSRKGLGAATQLKAEDQAQERARQSPARVRCYWSENGDPYRRCGSPHAPCADALHDDLPVSTRYWVGLYPIPLGVRVVQCHDGRIGSMPHKCSKVSLECSGLQRHPQDCIQPHHMTCQFSMSCLFT